MKFKVLDGKHHTFLRDPERPMDVKTVAYPKNSIVESDIDLAERYNRPGARKFERVADSVPVVQAKQHSAQDEMEEREANPVDPYNGLTKAELVRVANENDIDLPNGANKAQVLAILREETLGVFSDGAKPAT